MAKSKTFQLGRDAGTGRFIPVQGAKGRPHTTMVERIPKRVTGKIDELRLLAAAARDRLPIDQQAGENKAEPVRRPCVAVGG